MQHVFSFDHGPLFDASNRDEKLHEIRLDNLRRNLQTAFSSTEDNAMSNHLSYRGFKINPAPLGFHVSEGAFEHPNCKSIEGAQLYIDSLLAKRAEEDKEEETRNYRR